MSDQELSVGAETGANDNVVGSSPDGSAHPGGAGFFNVRSVDPTGTLVSLDALTEEDINQIDRLMNALGSLRHAEQRLSDASQRFMKLNPTDMRALHFMIVAANTGDIVTPGAIAQFLSISTASVTKLLDRLEHAGHVVRSPHPHDRRALSITITPTTHLSAMETAGRGHATKFLAAQALSPRDREAVIRFLSDLTRRLENNEFASSEPSASELPLSV